MPKITFEHAGVTVDAEEGEWMYDVAERADAKIPFACKAGACGTCATPVVSGIEHIAPATMREKRTLAEHDLDAERHRLVCLKDVGAGEVVWGKPVNSADEDEALDTFDVRVESYRPLNLSVAEVRFFVERDDFRFKPGQYMIFHIPDAPRTIRRSYSISTPPSDARHFEVCVRSVAGGYGSNYIHRLRPGDQLQVEGPYGDFVLEEDSERDILMIATGTGIAPIKSMLMHLLDQGSRRRVRLFFGVRNDSDLFYTDLFRGLAAHYPAFEYWITLSQADPARWAGHRGRVTQLIGELVGREDAKNTDVYMCGSRPMIESCTDALCSTCGFSEKHIHHERFY